MSWPSWHIFTFFGMLTVTACDVLVFAPSVTAVSSVYEDLRKSMSNGRLMRMAPVAPSMPNIEPPFPPVICQFAKVVKPGWFLSSASVATALPIT